MSDELDNINTSIKDLEREATNRSWWKHFLTAIVFMFLPLINLIQSLYIAIKVCTNYCINTIKYPKEAYEYVYSTLWYNKYLTKYTKNLQLYINKALKSGASIKSINQLLNPNYVDQEPPEDKNLLN